MFQFRKAEWIHKNSDFRLPERKTRFSAGYDFYLPRTITLEPGVVTPIQSGVCWQTIKDVEEFGMQRFYGDLSIRSSMCEKLELLAGDIDMDYEYPNEIIIKIMNKTKKQITVSSGDRICQMIITPFFMNYDDVKSERVGGFGSTGV